MSKLEQISAFIAVVESKGFAAAAKKLKCSTASVSRQVNHLERELGTQLLQRTTRRLALTEIGKQYYQHCKKTLEELAEAEAGILATHQEAIGLLHIKGTPRLCQTLLFPRLLQFMAENPKLKIKLEVEEKIADFEKENIDIFFGGSFEGAADLVRRRLRTTRYALVASPEYLKKHGIPKKPADLLQHRYIEHSNRLLEQGILFKNGLRVKVSPFFLINDSDLMLDCAIRGMGIVNLQSFIVEEAIKNQQLIEVLSEYQEKAVNVYLYYKSTKFLKAKIRRFVDFFTTE